MVEMFERQDLAELTAEQLAPLELLFTPEWPDTWKELATSQYLTLRSAPGAEQVPAHALAQLAIVLTMGIGQDMGGTQPYIPVGADLVMNARMRRVIDMLARQMSYKQAADATGLTESRVRHIERAWRREQIAARQGRLQLD